MESSEDCFSACFSHLSSTNLTHVSGLPFRQERINKDQTSNKKAVNIHSLSKKKESKLMQKQIENQKIDALMMIVHSKIGKDHRNKTPQKIFIKPDINFTSSRKDHDPRCLQSNISDSNFKSYPDQRSTNCKQYFSVNQSDGKFFRQNSLKMSQRSQNSNSKVGSNGSIVKSKKCQVLLLESRLKAQKRQIKHEQQKILEQGPQFVEVKKKVSNHILKHTINLRYSMVESSNSKQIAQTPVKINSQSQQFKKPLSSAGRIGKKIGLQKSKNPASQPQNKSQKRLFHNLTPSTSKIKCEKVKKQSQISFDKQQSQTYRYPLKLNKTAVESQYVSEGQKTSKMYQIINKIVSQDGRKTSQLKHINMIKIPNANHSFTNIPTNNDSTKDIQNCFLKKKPISQEQKGTFSHNKKKQSPMDMLMDQSLGFFNDQMPIRSIELNINSEKSSNSNQLKTKIHTEIIKNKFLGIGRYFNNHLSFIKQVGFAFNMKEVSIFTIKNQGIQHKIYQSLDVSTRLFHPNILRVYYASNWSNKLTIYEQLGQGNLDDELSKSMGRFSQEKAVKTLRQILQGLAYIHSYAGHGFAHKALKPKNVVFVNGTPKIQWMGYEDSMISGYISPQMRRGSPCGKKSDIWSIGIIAYVMIYGTMPIIETSFETSKILQVDQQKEGSMKESIIQESEGRHNMKLSELQNNEFQSKSIEISLQSNKEDDRIELSSEYQDFLKKTLQEYERNRMSAIECLAHPLIRKYKNQDEEI